MYASDCDLSPPDVEVMTPIFMSPAALAKFAETGRTKAKVSKEISDVLSEDFLDIESPRKIRYQIT
jgi:hypothetical protein